jgi:hypothetical protein
MRTLFCFLGALVLLATSAFALDRGGVGVGNGRSVYHSPVGFTVSYAEALSLSVESDLAFAISNDELVSKTEKVSRIRFEASENAVKNLAELSAKIAKEHPGKRFAPSKLPGAQGFFSEEKTESRLDGWYFLLTSNLHLLEIRIEAYPSGNGLALIAPIVRTFTYDATKPVVHEIRLGSEVWRAGSVQTVRVRAEDDNSGIYADKEDAFSFVGLSRVKEDGSLERGKDPIILLGLWRDAGGGWYETRFTVPSNLAPGNYVIDGLSISDLAYNTLTLMASDREPGFFWQESPKLPLPKLRIENSGVVDTTDPVFLGFREQEEEWQAGGTYRIYFQARDEESGITLKEMKCDGLGSTFERNGISFLSRDNCGSPRREGSDWYSVEIKLNPYLPTGEYYVDGLSFFDKAGNHSRLGGEKPFTGYYSNRWRDEKAPKRPVFRVKVRNSGVEDDKAPELLELRLETLEWKAGSQQTVRFRAKDTVSGINVGGPVSGLGLPVADDGPFQMLHFDGTIVSEGNDWYRLTFEVDEFLQALEYFLHFFGFSDRAGNQVFVECKKSHVNQCTSESGSAIPAMRVKVVR